MLLVEHDLVRKPVPTFRDHALMLKGIDPLLSADLLWVLAAMGHGDDIAVVDGNHPAETIARATTSGKLVRLPGVTMERAIAAILTVLPIDDFTPDPARRMEVVGKPDEIPAVQRAVQAVIDTAAGRTLPLHGIERHAFYTAARGAFAVVQCVDPRPYGCFLIRKGVIRG
jgi:L-fucose mutarotase